MIVLIGTNRNNGKIFSVGLYQTIDDARYAAHRALSEGKLFSVWTPDVGTMIESPTVTGLSLPPEKSGDRTAVP